MKTPEPRRLRESDDAPAALLSDASTAPEWTGSAKQLQRTRLLLAARPQPSTAPRWVLSGALVAACLLAALWVAASTPPGLASPDGLPAHSNGPAGASGEQSGSGLAGVSGQSSGSGLAGATGAQRGSSSAGATGAVPGATSPDAPLRGSGSADAQLPTATADGLLSMNATATGDSHLALRTGVIELSRGKLKLAAASSLPLRGVSTPHLRAVELVSSRFAVAADAFTEVGVATGSVRIERPDGSLVQVLGPGELFDSRSLAPAVLPSSQRRVEALRARAPGTRARSCSGEPVLRDCLAKVGRGSDLAAQNALLELALLERSAGQVSTALEHVGDYLRRFPEGVLAPEVRLLELQLRLSAPDDEVLALTERYLSTYGTEPSAAWVALVRADVSFRAGSWVQAENAYLRVLVFSPTASLKAEALFWAGMAALQDGREPQAKRSFRAALAAQPQGPRSEELRSKL